MTATAQESAALRRGARVPVGAVSAAATAAAEGSSHARILRLFGRFIGAGYLGYIVLLSGAYGALAEVTAGWWTPVAIVVIFGTGLALGLSTFLGDVAWVHRCAAANALGFVAVSAAWFLAWDGGRLDADFQTWHSAIPGVASLAAAAAWRPVLAFVHMFVAVSLVQVTNHVVSAGAFTELLVPDLLFAYLFCAVFVAAASMAFRTGRVLDATIVDTHTAAARAAAARAESVERRRFDALIHDTVLSTLLVASRSGDPSATAPAARRALASFDSLRVEGATGGGVGPEQALAHVRTAVTDVDERVRPASSVTEAAGTFPLEVVRAIAAAAGEAMRNSVAHAGPSARLAVDAVLAPGRMEVRVVDDGVGFDPRAVDRHRLGLAVSIRGRMEQIDGGSAEVDSAPGAGTTVTLRWARAS